MNNKYIILGICGPSAAGKDTLAYALEKEGMYRLVSDTTRPARSYEKDGVDYHFISTPHFLLDKNYLEWTEFRGWYYGTNKNRLKPGINIGVFNPSGMIQLSQKKDIVLIPILLEYPLIKRLRRSYLRENKWKLEYFRRAWTDFKDFKRFKKFLNNHLNNCLILKNYESTASQISRIKLHLNQLGLGNFL